MQEQTREQRDAEIVRRVLEGDTEAYGVLVEQYRNGVYGLAYHHLRNFEAAREATQEAFVQAYQKLPQLRNPERFLPWLRQITLNACHLEGRQRQRILPLEESSYGDADVAVEQIASRLVVQQALSHLSEACRLTLTLFYFYDYSVKEIAAFLELPITTIKSRLRDARARMEKELSMAFEQCVKEEPMAQGFAARVVALCEAIRSNDMSEVKQMLTDEPELASGSRPHPVLQDQEPAVVLAADKPEILDLLLEHGADINARTQPAGVDGDQPFGRTALHNVLNDKRQVAYLIAHGAQPDLFAVAALGDLALVEAFLGADPDSACRPGPDGATPLHFAGTAEVAALLLDHGADINALDAFHRRPPIWWHIKNPDMALFLKSRGADVDIFTAVCLGDHDLARELLRKDPSLANRRMWRNPDRHPLYTSITGASRTPLHYTAARGDLAMVRLLLEHRADVDAVEEEYQATPLAWAVTFGHADVIELLHAHNARLIPGMLEEAEAGTRGEISWSPASPEQYRRVVALLHRLQEH
jgi:RNA polymerase sigma factor (sigma-70 family)